MIVVIAMWLLLTCSTLSSLILRHSSRCVGLSRAGADASMRQCLALNQFKNCVDAERELSDVIQNTDLKGRGSKLSVEVNGKIESIISYLEASQSKSPVDPIYSPSIDGCWKLLYTSSPGTNSPIQRTFTAFDSIGIYQVINLLNTTNSFLPGRLPDVSNTVIFNNQVRLRVTALASTARKPIIVPRRGDGRILGLNLFGVSSSAAPRRSSERIDFSFQEARFEGSSGLFNSLPAWNIPYPVPFKLLGMQCIAVQCSIVQLATLSIQGLNSYTHHNFSIQQH